MYRFLIYINTFIFLVLSVNLSAQDIHFSQYYANPLYLNPAFAGTATCPRMILNFRNQWPSLAGDYVSYSASFDKHTDQFFGGFGLMFNADDAGEGTLKTNIISAIYSYRGQISRSVSFKLAFQASYFQKKLDWSKLTFNDMISPKYGFIYITKDKQPPRLTSGAPDFAAGMLCYGENFFAGFAAHHITQPSEGFNTISRLPAKITLHGGAIITTSKNSRRRRVEDPYFSPNILFMKQQDYKELNYGLYYNKYPLVGGIWYRHGFTNSDALIVLLGVQTTFLKFGYSYDVTVSKLGTSTGGSHEISLAYNFECRTRLKRIRPINCPLF